MTKGQRTVTSLLAVVTVLLLLDLGIRMTTTAQAAPPWLPPPVDDSPTVVGMAIGKNDVVWRVWSDGVMETRRWDPDNLSGGNGRCWENISFNDWITVVECP